MPIIRCSGKSDFWGFLRLKLPNFYDFTSLFCEWLFFTCLAFFIIFRNHFIVKAFIIVTASRNHCALYPLFHIYAPLCPILPQLQLIPWPRQKRVCAVHAGPLGGRAGHRPGVGPTRSQRHATGQHRGHHPVRSLLHQRIQLGGDPGTGLRRHSPGRLAFLPFNLNNDDY